MSLPIQIRSATQGDLPLLLKTWLNGASEQKHYGTALSDDDMWGHALRLLVCHLLAVSDVRIAHRPGHPDQIYGFAVTSPGVLHWVYTKYTFRKERVATRLLSATHPRLGREPLDCTFWTAPMRHHQRRWKLIQRPDRLTGLFFQDAA